MTVAQNSELKLGHISLTEANSEQLVKLVWDERPDMVDSAHRVIMLVETNFSNTNVSNYHLAWRLEEPATFKDVKYFRIFRDDKFLGITTSMFYMDKRVEFTSKLVYTVEAIGHNQEILDSIKHSLLP